jgi:hypothetical protein
MVDLAAGKASQIGNALQRGPASNRPGERFAIDE